MSAQSFLEFTWTSSLSSPSIITIFVLANRALSVTVNPNGTGNFFVDE